MSDSLAIAAVTKTLWYLLNTEVTGLHDSGLGSFQILHTPLDKASGQINANTTALNLFLYQSVPNAAWRNMDLPSQTRPGETGQPPLALDLNYLLTAYGADDDDLLAHRLLGHAMRILNDHAVLSPSEIQAIFPESNLYDQIERIRLTPITLSVEEISKLWTAFQTNYRVSAAYQVSVVLIESKRPVRTPLPVLTRGPVDPLTHQDTGVVVQANMLSPFPTLTGVTPPNEQLVAQLGDTLTLTGYHLDGTTVSLLITNVITGDTLTQNPAGSGTATQVTVTLPNVPTWPAAWAPGTYSIAAVVTPPSLGETRTSNALPFSVAPTITAITPGAITANGDGTFSLTVQLTFTPPVRAGQHVLLLFGGQAFAAPPLPPSTNTLTFTVASVAAGDYYLRLRVEGVDSLLVDMTKTPPIYDPTKKVTV